MVTKVLSLRMVQPGGLEPEKLNNLHCPEIVPFVVERMASFVQKEGFPRGQRHGGGGGLGRGTNVVVIDAVLQAASEEHRFCIRHVARLARRGIYALVAEDKLLGGKAPVPGKKIQIEGLLPIEPGTGHV